MSSLVTWEHEALSAPEAEDQSWRLFHRGRRTSAWIYRESFLDTFPYTVILGDGADCTVAGRCRTLAAAQVYAVAMAFPPGFDASCSDCQEFFIQG